jgi:hypothetical protein
MKRNHLAIFCLFVCVRFLQPGVAFAQTTTPLPEEFNRQYLSATLQFLASPSLEGRETGTRGGMLAANYIASRMMQSGLVPAFIHSQPSNVQLSDYFQPFELERYTTTSAVLEVAPSAKGQPAFRLHLATDFSVENDYQDFTGKYPLVFAGYGIHMPAQGYDSYQGLDVKGKIVMFMEGFPGEGDTLGETWKKFRSDSHLSSYSTDERYRNAGLLGAAAVIILKKEFWSTGKPNEHLNKKNCGEDIPYQDASYMSPGTQLQPGTPMISPDLSSCRKLIQAYGLKTGLLDEIYKGHVTKLKGKDNCTVKIDLRVVPETITVLNVGGLLRGIDTTHTVIVGAHYDHLGKRGELTYYGSDDNASGVTGVLAMAALYSSGKKPAENILFACWTGEEKGLLGSEYYALQLNNTANIDLYLNMDMISRSAPEDSAGKIVSVGTRTSDVKLRTMAEKINLSLQKPAALDLWDVTGHTGSDYASFTAKGIPVMTFFSGFHDEYHTPCDVPASADFRKMGGILSLVRGCLDQILSKTY